MLSRRLTPYKSQLPRCRPPSRVTAGLRLPQPGDGRRNARRRRRRREGGRRGGLLAAAAARQKIASDCGETESGEAGRGTAPSLPLFFLAFVCPSRSAASAVEITSGKLLSLLLLPPPPTQLGRRCRHRWRRQWQRQRQRRRQRRNPPPPPRSHQVRERGRGREREREAETWK